MFHTLLIVLPLVEQHIDEQECSDAVSGELSGLETKVLESAEEATQSTESIYLSLVDDLSKIIVGDSAIEELTNDITVEDEGKVGENAAYISNHG